ncbi:MAG: DUF1893 domain-containing protein [Candidatus Bathyarchaeia archaeon]
MPEKSLLCQRDSSSRSRKNEQFRLFEVGEVTTSFKDLETAKRGLSERHLTLCVVKEGHVIFEARTHGVLGLVEAVEEFKDRLDGASVADRVVGKAIALLCVYVNVRAVYAATISKAAKALLEGNSVYLECDSLVENILGADKSKTCPFEQLVDRIADPGDAYRKLKNACGSATRFNPHG